jgi:hypothetical protein
MLDIGNIWNNIKASATNSVNEAKSSIVDNFKSSITGDYSAAGLTYPTDLMSSEYGKSYMLFYINVSNKSTVSEGRGNQVFGGNISEFGSEIAGQVAGLKSTLGEDAWVARSTRRLAKAIALYIPNDLSINYNANWSTIEIPIISGAAELGDSGIRGLKTYAGRAMPGEEISGEGVAAGAVEAGGAAALGLGGLLGEGGGLSVLTGFTPNPKKEQQFQGVDFREFQLQYIFAPRDENEAETVNKIIKAFKFHMHPEFLSRSKFIYVYPSEFDIEYHFKGSQNQFVHKHATSVLTGMSLNYTPNGVYNVYDSGISTQIVMTLQFKELMVVTKEGIDRGL